MAIDDNTSYELTGYQVKDLASKVRAKADSSALASVATSGLYSDLTGTPTIPTVNNGTLTIQQDGTTLGTFSANQSTNETINITGGGGGAVTYYIADGDPNYPQTLGTGFVYEDAARTIAAEAADVYADIQSGKTVYLEYRTGPATDRRETMFTINSMTRRDTQGVVDQYDYFGSMTSYMDGSNTTMPAAFGFLVQGTEPLAWQFVQQYIPTVNNATLTIQQNGTNIQTFTANSSTNKTANIDTHNGVMTAWNLVPTADTTAGWRALFPTDGVYVTFYDSNGSFTNKPSGWGVLTTKISYQINSTTNFEIYQSWVSSGGGVSCTRRGNTTGWYGNAADSGSFTTIEDGLSIGWHPFAVTSVSQAARTGYLPGRNTFTYAGSGQGGINIYNMPSGVKMYRVKSILTLNSTITNKSFGISNLKASTTAFTRWSGIVGNTTKAWAQYSGSTGTSNYANLIGDTTQLNGASIEYTAFHGVTSGGEWSITGKINIGGQNSVIDFMTICTAKDATSPPYIYIRGISASDVSSFMGSLEVFS